MAEVKRESRPQTIADSPASVNFNNPDSSSPVQLRCTIAKRRKAEDRIQKSGVRRKENQKKSGSTPYPF
jgi:hypothetical protein